MKIYVLTSDFETVAVMDNALDSALHYFDDEFHRYLENGASTFDLSVVKPFKRYGNATDGTEDDYQYLVENNYLVFTYQDKDYMFNIRRVEETEISMQLYCQNLSLDLLNEYRGPYTADKAYKLEKYVNDALFDSGYKIGINEFANNTRSLKWEGDQTCLARILSIANSFDAEVDFETVLNADRTIDKNLVHFRKRIGVDRPDVELKYGKDVSSIRRTVDIDDLITSIKPRGHEEDGKYVTVKNVVKEEKNTDGEVEYFTKKGSEHIYAPLATQKYGRKNPESYGSIDGKYEYDTKSDTELYNRALAELKKRCVPSYEYEIEGYYDVNIGDTIRAIDEAYNPILILEARVSEQIISFSDPSKNQTKYSNYKVLENKVSQSLLDRANELAQMAKILQYGIDFEGSPVFKNGEGTLKLYAHVDRNNVEVTDEFTEYNWTKKNADGTVDEAWTKAHQDFGEIVTVTSDDIDGTAVFSFTVEINGEQAGNATITVSKVYDGEQGETGVGVKSTVVTYQQSSSGTTTPQGTWSSSVPNVTKGNYLWTKTVTTYTNNSTNTGYSVSYFAKDGSKGDKGDPTGITVSSTAPSSPYTNQLWKNTGTSDGRIQNATYRYNGSSWELYTFVANNIIADTLSAIVTNTGSLNVTESLTSTFNNVPLDPVAPNGSKASGELALGGGKLSITGKIDGKMPFEVEYATTGFDAMVRDPATSKIIGHVHMDAKDGFYVDNGLQSTTIMPGLMMLAKQGSPYSPVILSFEDFITIPETVLTAKSGFENYSTSATNRPTARRTVGRVITLSGAFKNKSDIKSGTEEIEMGQVPDWARPTSPVNFVVQGTSMNRYLLYVDTTGRITISRYGTDSNYGTISSGSWLNIACMYTAK